MPKRTHQPHKRHRARTHGFRARMSSKAGIKVLKRLRIKGRKKLSVENKIASRMRAFYFWWKYGKIKRDYG